MIAFHQPYKSNNERNYIEQVLASGKTGGNGEYTVKCENYLKELLQSPSVLMTTSCTHSLELIMQLLDFTEPYEVILPSYTFTTTATAVLQNRGKVIFSEIDPDTLCIDPKRIEEKITLLTKAIIVVHYGGQACDMDPIMEIADRYHLVVIEDAAQGLLSSYKGKMLGTIGHFGCFSFHETKNITCGEGGALSINYQLDRWYKAAHNIRQKGTNRLDFDRGDVEFYQWVSKGSSYIPSELLMAYLYGQLEEHEIIQEKRRNIFNQYKSLFEHEKFSCVEKFSSGNCFGLFNSHIFYFLLKEEIDSQKLLRSLGDQEIPAYTHFVPLHMSKMGKSFGYQETDFPFESSISKRLIRLPLHSMMDDKTADYIITGVKHCLRSLPL